MPYDPSRADYGHPWRTDPRFGKPEIRPPPPLRSHDKAVAQGAESDSEPYFTYNDKTGDKPHPRYASGINGSSPLSDIPLFDIVWDLYADGMHMLVNFFGKTTKSMGGARGVTKPASFGKVHPEDHPEHLASLVQAQSEHKRYVHAYACTRQFKTAG